MIYEVGLLLLLFLLFRKGFSTKKCLQREKNKLFHDSLVPTLNLNEGNWQHNSIQENGMYSLQLQVLAIFEAKNKDTYATWEIFRSYSWKFAKFLRGSHLVFRYHDYEVGKTNYSWENTWSNTVTRFLPSIYDSWKLCCQMIAFCIHESYFLTMLKPFWIHFTLYQKL